MSTQGFDLLETLYVHRLMSTTHLGAIHTPGKGGRYVGRRLRELRAAEQVGCVNHRGPAPLSALLLWYLTEAGAEHVEVMHPEWRARRKLFTPEQAAGALQLHTLAVNDVGMAFLESARLLGHDFGPLAWRHEVPHYLSSAGPRGELLVADAVLQYRLPDADVDRFYWSFVELDRATMPVRDLFVKLRRYARLRRFEEAWSDRYVGRFPDVLLVLAGADRASLLRRAAALAGLCQGDADLSRTPILVGLLEDLTARGPFAPVFVPLARPDADPVNWLGQVDLVAAG